MRGWEGEPVEGWWFGLSVLWFGGSRFGSWALRFGVWGSGSDGDRVRWCEGLGLRVEG